MDGIPPEFPMFTKEDIFRELSSSGGRMLNSQLVLRFARYLKNPSTKEEAKAKFKDYVNKMATLVTDPLTGDKFVVLRPEAREQLRRNCAPPVVNPSLVMSSAAAVKGQPLPMQPGPPAVSHHRTAHQNPARKTSQECQPQAPTRPSRQPPMYQQAVTASKLNRPPQNAVHNPTSAPVSHPMQNRPSSLKLVHDNQSFMDGSPGHQRRGSAGTINTQLLQQSGMVIPKNVNGSPVPPPPPPSRSLSKSVPSLLSETDSPPVVPSRSRRHSAKGTVVEEKVKQFAEKEFVKDEVRQSVTEKTSVAVSPGTVMEKVRMLKMTSEGNLTAPQPQINIRAAQNKDTGRRILSSRNSNQDSDDKCSVSTLDPLRREFCRKAMTCDYQSMQKMLQEDPSLAKAIDYVLGYNALHWAAKYGHSDVVKLIAGTYNVDPNIKTRGAGQTPLHIAYMFNQRAIIDLLIMTYGAQKDVRDFSGRKPDFYGNQKNVETLRSKIYHQKEKEDKFEGTTFASKQKVGKTRRILDKVKGRTESWRTPTLRSISLVEDFGRVERKATNRSTSVDYHRSDLLLMNSH